MRERAIITLAIGDKFELAWRKHCEASWRQYGRRWDCDVIAVTEPLDKSSRAQSRSPAWQKCIVPTEFANRYRRLLLLDSDIVIHSSAPNIFEQCSEEAVGGVLSGSHIQDDLKLVLLSRLTKTPVVYEREQRQWRDDQALSYESYRLSPHPAGIIQTGVLLVSPQKHADLFRAVYEGSYRETRCFEQIPLSYALLSAGVFQQIDTRFNSVLYETLLVHHHYLFTQQVGEHVTRAVVRAELANNFFLHFAYDASLMRFLSD